MPSRHDHRSHNQRKKTWFSVTTGLFILIAIALFGLAELKPKRFDDNVQATAAVSAKTNTNPLIGDLQIDHTIALIQQGGPFPYPHKDGSTFYNREGRLPTQPQSYYREYTVPTPGVSHRGARRIVTGGNPPTVYYLTVDHYDSFIKLDVS